MSMQSHGSVSQRGLLSISMLMFSVGGLGIAMLAGAKLVFDIFDVGLWESLDGLVIKVIVVGLAYLVGWGASMLAIRVYGNLVLPFIINLFIWGILIGICTLYLMILQRLYNQQYDLLHFMAYVAVMASAAAAMIGLHLVLEGHDLRPLAIPILVIVFIQLGLIVLRYVFHPGCKACLPDLRPDIFYRHGVFLALHAGPYRLAGTIAPADQRITLTETERRSARRIEE